MRAAGAGQEATTIEPLPKGGYARTGCYAYLRMCERFGVMPWDGEWDAGQEALVAEFVVVREMEEQRA